MSLEKLFLDLALLLLAAKILGILTEKAGFSTLIGEILAGILLGPILLLVHPAESLEMLANLGLIVLLFLIGLETKYEDIKKDTYVGSFLAFTGSLLSFIGGLAVGIYFFDSFNTGLFIGVQVTRGPADGRAGCR